MRRLRASETIRNLVRETSVAVSELIYPIFVTEGENIKNPIPSMPDIYQYSIDRLNEELERVAESGISGILIFGIPKHKDEVGSSAYDDNGITQRAIRYIKGKYPKILVIADVCLCEYTSHGHCGLIHEGKILNDETLPLLAKASVSLAKAGADIIAPSDMMIRLVSSGTEATMSAIRVARGYTKRDIIVKFKGCYHGHSDGLLVKAGSAALTNAVPDSAGVPVSYIQNTLVANYNDDKSVEKLFEQYGNNIAAIIVEPVAANMGVVLPANGFLEFLRRITREYGALLIFDEVITGFRIALGGATQYFNIQPDLITLGKIVGGGMPIGAYGGRKDIMQMVSPLGEVYQAGTLSGNPIATTAGITTLNILKNNPQIYTKLDQKAKLIRNAFQKGISPGIVRVNQIGSILSPFFTESEVVNYNSALTSDTKRYADYFNFLLNQGIYIAPSRFEAMFISNAHDEQDIKTTCDIIDAYFNT